MNGGPAWEMLASSSLVIPDHFRSILMSSHNKQSSWELIWERFWEALASSSLFIHIFHLHRRVTKLKLKKNQFFVEISLVCASSCYQEIFVCLAETPCRPCLTQSSLLASEATLWWSHLGCRNNISWELRTDSEAERVLETLLDKGVDRGGRWSTKSSLLAVTLWA